MTVAKSGPDILLSKNEKTGASLNWPVPQTCRPTPWCEAHCYARMRTGTAEERNDLNANGGPITWPLTQKAYARNLRHVRRLHALVRGYALFGGTGEALALQRDAAEVSGVPLTDITASVDRLARQARRMGAPLRLNGCGDFVPATIWLTTELAKRDVPMFGFTRKPGAVLSLRRQLDVANVRAQQRPVLWGSVDVTTPWLAEKALTESLALYYAGDLGALQVPLWNNRFGHSHLVCAIESLEAYMEHLRARDAVDVQGTGEPRYAVVFGYHTNYRRTTLGLDNECHATTTAGHAAGVTCATCRRCYGHLAWPAWVLEKEQAREARHAR